LKRKSAGTAIRRPAAVVRSASATPEARSEDPPSPGLDISWSARMVPHRSEQTDQGRGPSQRADQAQVTLELEALSAESDPELFLHRLGGGAGHAEHHEGNRPEGMGALVQDAERFLLISARRELDARERASSALPPRTAK